MTKKLGDKDIPFHLVKQRRGGNTAVWYWINPMTGAIMSPEFNNSEAAENWFDLMSKVFSEMVSLMDRVKNGDIIKITGRVDPMEVLGSDRAKNCPFGVVIINGILEANILAVDVDDGRRRVTEFYNIMEWV